MQENHSVTVDPTQQSLPVSRINQTKFYLKAGAVLLATTAVYAVARATRLLPQWQSADSNPVLSDAVNINAAVNQGVVDADQMKITVMEETLEVSQQVRPGEGSVDQVIRSASHNSLTEFQEIQLGLAKQKDIEAIDRISATSTHKRQLLQTSAPVVIANPIPDQIIQIGEPYTYDLSKVFSGEDYLMITASEIGQNHLPSWLSLQYKQINTYTGNSPVYTTAISQDILFTISAVGLQILDVSDIMNPQLLSINKEIVDRCPPFDCLYKDQCQKIVISENNLFITCASGLQIVDVSDLMNPQLLGNFTYSPAKPTGIAVIKEILLLTDWTAGLYILDIKNFIQPRLLANYRDSLDFLSGVINLGNTVFVAGQSIHIFDVSNQTNLKLLNNYFPGCIDLILLNNHTLFVSGSARFDMIDISNVSSPYLLSSYLEDCLSVVSPNGMTIWGNTAFLSCGVKGLMILDISNVTNITAVATYPLQNGYPIVGVSAFKNTVCIEGGSNSPLVYFKQVSLSGTPLADDFRVGQQLSIKVSARSANGTILATQSFKLTFNNLPKLLQTTLTDQSIFPGQPFLLPINNGQLFTNPSSSSLHLSLNSANGKPVPAWLKLNILPNLVNVYPNYFKSFVRSKDILLGLKEFEFQVIDSSTPENPTFFPAINGFSHPYGVIDGNTLFSIHNIDTGVRIFNISDPVSPTYLGIYLNNIGYSTRIVVSKNTLFIPAVIYSPQSAYYLQIVDVTNRTSPKLLLSYNDSNRSEYEDIFMVENTMFVADSSVGLKILDMSNFTNPKLLNTFASGYASSITVAEEIVFLSVHTEGVKIIDVNDLSNPKLKSIFPTNQYVYIPKLMLSGRMLFLCQLSSKTQPDLQIIDITNLTSPRLLGVYPAIDCRDIVILKNTVYLSDSEGFKVLDLRTWQLTANPTTSDEGNYYLKLTATDIIGSSVSKAFSIRVEGPPRIHAPIPAQYAKVGQSFYLASAGTFTDPNFDPLVFTLVPINSTALPAWLNFDPVTVTFSGTPAILDMGTVIMQLTATDPLGGTASNTFNITVTRPPQVANVPQPLTLIQGIQFIYIIPSNTFNSYGVPLSYDLASGDGSPLPLEFSFTPGNLTLSGTPMQTGIMNLLLTGRDSSNGELSTLLSLLIHANLPVLPSQYAKVSQAFSYYAAVSDGLNNPRFNPLVFAASRVDQTALPSWLSFNPGTFTFVGTPSSSEVGIISLRLIAIDSLGNSAHRDFNLTILYAPAVNNPITQAVNLVVGRSFSFSIPQGTFYDYGQALTYALKSVDGSGFIPPWIQFNPNNGTLLGTPPSIGAVTLFISAEDAAHNQASTPLSLIISANAPPQVMQPISTQTAQVGQQFNFFVPANTFADPNGDPLTYSASLLGGSAFPGWLSFDPKTVSFKGTPGGTDTDAFSTRIHTVVLVASDPEKAKAEILFNLNVGGTSSVASALKIGAPIISVLGALFGLYKNRAHIINRVRYPKYQQPGQEIRVGEPFILQLSTPRHLVGSVKAKTAHVRSQGCARFIDGQRFFKKPLHYLQLPFDKLPGGESLPRWMEYDEDSNILCSKGPVPNTHYRELNIRVKDKNGVVTEQFNLRIEGATLTAIPEAGERKSLSTLPTSARLQKEQGQSAIEMPGLRDTTEEPASPAACV